MCLQARPSRAISLPSFMMHKASLTARCSFRSGNQLRRKHVRSTAHRSEIRLPRTHLHTEKRTPVRWTSHDRDRGGACPSRASEGRDGWNCTGGRDWACPHGSSDVHQPGVHTPYLEKAVEEPVTKPAPSSAASALSLPDDAVLDTWCASAGIRFTFIHLTNRAAVNQAALNRDP